MNPFLSRFTRVLLASGAIFACLALAPAAAQAQAWLPPEGTGSLTLDYSNILNKKHFTSTGAEIDAGHTELDVLTLAGSYSPRDRWLVNFSLPFVQAHYYGPSPHPTEVDDSHWHQTVTDLQLSVHYQLTDGRIAFSPYLGLITPTQKYETLGHAAPGRGLDEYWAGFYAASSLNEWIPRTYAQVRANHAFVEEVAGVSHDRTNASLEIGYFLNQSVSFRALASWQWTHGGVDVPVPRTSPLFPYHDRLAAEDFFNVGAGSSWIVNDRLSVYGVYMHALSGRNGHKLEHRVSMGMSYSLGGP